jgi:hypothetical protein
LAILVSLHNPASARLLVFVSRYFSRAKPAVIKAAVGRFSRLDPGREFASSGGFCAL